VKEILKAQPLGRPGRGLIAGVDAGERSDHPGNVAKAFCTRRDPPRSKKGVSPD